MYICIYIYTHILTHLYTRQMVFFLNTNLPWFSMCLNLVYTCILLHVYFHIHTHMHFRWKSWKESTAWLASLRVLVHSQPTRPSGFFHFLIFFLCDYYWAVSGVSVKEASWMRVFDPVYILLLDLYQTSKLNCFLIWVNRSQYLHWILLFFFFVCVMWDSLRGI